MFLAHPWALVGVGLAALGFYLYRRLEYHRIRQHAHLPRVKPSLFWGHLACLGEYYKAEGEEAVDSDYVFSAMLKSIGNPDVMVLDVRPFNRPILVIRDADIAEQVSKQTKAWPYSIPKNHRMGFLGPLIGSQSIILTTGHKWKETRKRFNPGFSHQHLMSLLPIIFDKTEPFLAHLHRYAQTGEAFTLEPLCTGMTFDIIGAVTMGHDVGAQLPADQQTEFIKLYRDLLSTYENDDGGVPAVMQPLTVWTRHRRAKRLDAHMRGIIQQKYEELKKQRQGKKRTSSRSVLALRLQDEDELTEDVVRDTIDQLKSFLFAGHDTTSILLQWAFYELSRTPRALKALRAELDDLFGPGGPDDADADLETVRRAFETNGEDLMGRMTYMSAVIKEILRLYPPAGTARYVPPGSNWHLTRKDGSKVCAEGVILYNCHPLIQRDEAIYGPTANDFIPERWLGNTDTWMDKEGEEEEEEEEDRKVAAEGGDGEDHEKKPAGRSIPAAAWRPFERGPRNCIGQELANIEARVILACAARKYDFFKVGAGEAKLDSKGKPILNEKGQHVSDSKVYTRRSVTSRPHDGIEVRVKLREGWS
ncbi:cytochrome P450 52A11 [Sodiomyces alkalinus F11]|uniref:Cytochrome P450 52A11 n=1 Tax=Sodiomyces alkalinus (strain CBS 110278 / VKM F-3762 / F11) TaxID=1314773 RepID=A0A3N2Q6I8_SODAK|nr:cytochrome P450 52A11 [Sodiomyces alkalinus F11]ROT42381.1 cytochrome P450 52A11 [Sodiomyces alkalinus F11]